MIVTAKSQLDKFIENFEKQDSFLTKKIKTEYLSDKDVSLNNFYCLNDNDIMVMGENMSVSGNLSQEEAEEILSFCQFMGIYGLESRQDNLPVKHRQVMNVMEYTGGRDIPAEDVIKNENIYQFSQFSCSNFVGSAFDTVYSYFARKVNKGISDIYYTTYEGKIVSGALATHFDNDIYLTFVSTAKKFRKQGRAAKILRHIVSQYPDSRVLLMCEKELLPFYEKLSFEKTGEIYLYTLREEHI